MPSFTLDQLAWFNRCLFLNDFKDALVRHGLPELDAYSYARYACQNRGILSLYQEYAVNDEALTAILNAVIVEFLSRKDPS